VFKKYLILLIFFAKISFSPLSLQAQLPTNLPALNGPQKQTLLLIARESVNAALEMRTAREATVEPRLMAAQALVVSLYVDGALRGRAWRLRDPQPLYLAARDLTFQAISNPKVNPEPLRPDELMRAELSIAVLSNYVRVNDDRDVPEKSAVIIYNGFTEWLALPFDVASNKAADLLNYACEQAGLRPHIWLLPETAIFIADVEESRESQF